MLGTWAAGLLLAALGASAGEVYQLGDREPFKKVLNRLERAREATVHAVCGSTKSPWAYRGPRGADRMLKPYSRGQGDRAWNRAFLDALFRSADWDSTHRFHSASKPCKETHAVPLFTVAWPGNPDVYALLSFEGRCALIFELGRPLGTVWFRDRADTLFALIRAALPEDSLVRAMATPPAGDTAPSFDRVWVDQLPEAIRRVAPAYPEAARARGISGVVHLQVVVGIDGLVKDAYVVKGVTGLEDAALEAVWQWQFRPARKGDEPLEVAVTVPIKFTLH